MSDPDFYILVYRQRHVVPVEHGQVQKTDQPLFPALRLRWDLFAQLYDYRNMELLDVLKAYDETGKLTLTELRQRVEQHNIELS
jgi:hypothetical protein